MIGHRRVKGCKRMSAYSHFLARGRDVVYLKDMSMMIGLGTREKPPASAKPDQSSKE